MIRIARRRGGFTLAELLVALAVGLAVVQIAFASFFIVRKYVNRIQRLEAAANLLQTAVTWYGFKGGSSPPEELVWVGTDYDGVDPANYEGRVGEAKIRRMPQRIIGNLTVDGSGNGHLVIYDLSNEAKAARARGEKRGITGYEAATPDPIILAEMDLK